MTDPQPGENPVVWSCAAANPSTRVRVLRRLHVDKGQEYELSIEGYPDKGHFAVLSRGQALELALELIADMVPRARPKRGGNGTRA